MIISSRAVKIPHKNGWSARKDALRFIKRCLKEVEKSGNLPQEMLNHLWLLEAHLNNRNHRRLASHMFEVYTSIEDGRCESIQQTLENLLEDLKCANRWRKQQLALQKAGISKAQ